MILKWRTAVLEPGVLDWGEPLIGSQYGMRVSAASALTRSSTSNCKLHDLSPCLYVLQQQMCYWCAWMTIKTHIPSSTSMNMAYLYERNRFGGHHHLSRKECEWIYLWKYGGKVPKFPPCCSAVLSRSPSGSHAMPRDMKLFHFSSRHKWEQETFLAM